MIAAPEPAAGAPGERFWRFSLDLYGRPEVAPACLRLQERLGLDVDLLLYCCWAASLGRTLSAGDVRQAVASVQPWQREIVRPMRGVRARMKQGFAGLHAAAVEALRQLLLQVEIEAERIEQFRLGEILPPADPGGRAPAEMAALNLRTYLGALEASVAPPDLADLACILRAGWPHDDLASPAAILAG